MLVRKNNGLNRPSLWTPFCSMKRLTLMFGPLASARLSHGPAFIVEAGSAPLVPGSANSGSKAN
jgi:hypothetical protein